jgi:hypothetical protein
MTEEQAAINELKSMSKEELDLVPYENVWITCCCKGCNSVHRVRDYGITPEYYSPKFGFVDAAGGMYWCGKHWKFRNRLVPIYGLDKVAWKLVDWLKKPILTDQEKIKLKNKRAK